MKLRSSPPTIVSVAFAIALFMSSGLLRAETAQAASPSNTKDSSADATPLPQPGPWLLAAGVVALGISRVRWRGRRRLV